MRRIAGRFRDLLPLSSRETPIVIAGVPLGGIPIASAISAMYDIPSILIRPSQKAHGKKKLIEGNYQGEECYLVEDVITSGGSVLETISIAEKAGVNIRGVIAIFDREEGGTDRIRVEGYEVKCLFKISMFIRAKL